jgi:hypothetical protein
MEMTHAALKCSKIKHHAQIFWTLKKKLVLLLIFHSGVLTALKKETMGIYIQKKNHLNIRINNMYLIKLV